MSYRDHDYTSHTGTHPVGDYRKTGGSAWGLAVVLVVLLGILGLAIMSGPADQAAPDGMRTPAIEQTTPAPGTDRPPAPAQPLD